VAENGDSLFLEQTVDEAVRDYIRLRPEDAAAIPDGEFLDLVRSAFGPAPGAGPAS
jgi:hypothetical protein